MTPIAQNIAHVQAVIAQACARSQRPSDAVTLVAVCKTQPVTRILEAVQAGVRHLGENRVEDANPKIVEVTTHTDSPITWHMIGSIQSRKARHVLEYDGQRRFGLVHSIDSLDLAARFSRMIEERGAPSLPVLAQVNVSGEASKSGFDAAGWQTDSTVRRAITAQIQQLMALPGLSMHGLMTMAPIVDEMEDARPVFQSLYRLREHLQQSLGTALPILSMGMTDDYPVAIEEGATHVRIGRAIFSPSPTGS
jgi:pyridoxal phosphate enzyme (YggS family)